MVVLKRRDARCLLLALWEECFICEVIFDERVIILVEVVMSEQHLEYVLAINVDVLLIKEELIVAHRDSTIVANMSSRRFLHNVGTPSYGISIPCSSHLN